MGIIFITIEPSSFPVLDGWLASLREWCLHREIECQTATKLRAVLTSKKKEIGKHRHY